MEELYRSEDREMSDNQEVEEEIPRNEEDIGPEVLGEELRAAIKELKNNKASGDRQYTSRDAQKRRGRCQDRTNKDMSRYIHNRSVARGLLTREMVDEQLKKQEKNGGTRNVKN